jgi:hypothetical protein
VSRGGVSIAGPLGRADAALTSAKDIPATPKIGAAFLRRLRFETCLVRDMAKSFHMLEGMFQLTQGAHLKFKVWFCHRGELSPTPSSMLLAAPVDTYCQIQEVM